jgi:hypothetical protein
MAATLKRVVALLLQLRGRQVAVAAIAVTVIVGASLAAACAGTGAADSGVRGRVWLGPLNPVERLGGPPNERPYAATIQVLKVGNGQVAATAHSGKDGRFRVDLAPGSYVLQGVSPSDFSMPHAAPVAVIVVAHRFTTAAVSFDTGIR